MADTNHLSAFSGVLRDLISSLRDALLFGVFVLLLFSPETVKARLIEAGFTKGTIGGMEWEAQVKEASDNTKSAGQTLSQAKLGYDELISRLAQLENKVTNPVIQRELDSIGDAAQSSRAELASADQAIKRSLVAQQQLVSQGSSTVDETTGWVFLGKVTEDKHSWEQGPPKTIHSIEPEVLVGATLTLKDDVYLRDDSATNVRAMAPLLAVVKMDEKLDVMELDYSHAKAGGWFVWAKVKRQPTS